MSGTAWKAFFVDSQDEVDRVEVDASQIEEQRLTAPGIRSEGSSVDSSTQMHGAGEMDQGEGKESLQMRTGEQVMPRMDLQLGETHQSREDVQQEVFKLHSAYKTYCENPRSGTPFKCCPVFARPPGYKSQFMLQLEAEALKHQPPSFSMKDAVCIVDPKRGAKITRAPYDLVSFAGPKGRKLYPDTEEGVLGLGEDGKQFVARTGGDNVPGKVKPWRFDIVRTKADEREKMASWIYVCVPYRKEAQTKIPRNPPPELDNEMVEFIDKLTAMMVEKAQNKGLLTEGDQQIQRFKKSFTAMLRPLILKFMGQKADPKWADFVFRRNYVQMELGKVFEHIDEYGHLPWVRSEVAVKETGIDLERDHVDLLEAVENLYLYLRNATSLQNHLQVDGDRTLSELPEQRELRRQFLTRIVAYSKMSSKRFCAVSLGSCMLTQCELAVIAKEITQILDGEQTDTENIARLLPKLGESKARQFAAEAARQKSAGETSKTACGNFNSLVHLHMHVVPSSLFTLQAYPNLLTFTLGFPQYRSILPVGQAKLGPPDAALCSTVQRHSLGTAPASQAASIPGRNGNCSVVRQHTTGSTNKQR